MIIQSSIEAFVSGVQNLLPDEIIPLDAASDSLNWLTRDGKIQLTWGRQLVGAAGATGKNYGEHTGFRADGTPVRFRKVGGTIQTLVGSTWTDVITGLTVAADYTFSNYSSLAGSFVYIFGIDGIYKICTANPTSYSSLYSSTKNFKGYAFIDKARTILWGRAEDPTGLYGSYIDAQDGDVYTTVTGESLTDAASGTLAFRSGHTTRTCFAVQITISGSGEIFTDNYNGVLTGSLGHTGTINYTTGVFTTTGTGAATANYQWEDSNAKGITDFTKSGTRLAGEGFVIRQDAGGDAIKVVIPFAGSYFSMKAHSCYKFTLDTTDLAPTNILFRTDIGVQSLRSATGTSLGIVYINTANAIKPRLEVLVQNPLGDQFDAKIIMSQFAFENYLYDDALLDTWDRYVILGCKSKLAVENDTLLLINIPGKCVDITSYGIRTSTKINGVLNGGDPVSLSTYELFTGFDDMGLTISNHWTSKGETLGSFKSRSMALRFIKNTLKKLKRLRLKGSIDPAQSVQVWVSYDDSDFQLVGTILGSGDYVDYTSTFAIGTSAVGESEAGGANSVSVNNFFAELKLHATKFRKRKIMLVATGIGYFSCNALTDWDYWLYQDKLPAKYRSKQNVDLSGAPVDEDNPDY